MSCRRYNNYDFERACRYRSYYNSVQHAYADGYDKGCEASARAALELAKLSDNHYKDNNDNDLNFLELANDDFDGYDDCYNGRRRFYRDYGCGC